MDSVMFYKKKYHIDLRDVDFLKRLKLSALFSYFQEVASIAAEKLGVGINALEDNFDLAWILMRMRVDITRLPKWEEEITIETWPLEPKRVEFERDFLVKDGEGNIIIRAISSWVVIDREKRKLLKTDTLSLKYPEIITERAIDDKLRKLKSTDDVQPTYKKVIGYSDIDFNGHLNNSRYIDYMMDCFPMEDHQKYSPTSVEVNFVHEALPGETIIMKTSTNGHEIYMEGVKEDDDTKLFKAKVTIAETS